MQIIAKMYNMKPKIPYTFSTDLRKIGTKDRASYAILNSIVTDVKTTLQLFPKISVHLNVIYSQKENCCDSFKKSQNTFIKSANTERILVSTAKDHPDYLKTLNHTVVSLEKEVHNEYLKADKIIERIEGLLDKMAKQGVLKKIENVVENTRGVKKHMHADIKSTLEPAYKEFQQHYKDSIIQIYKAFIHYNFTKCPPTNNLISKINKALAGQLERANEPQQEPKPEEEEHVEEEPAGGEHIEREPFEEEPAEGDPAEEETAKEEHVEEEHIEEEPAGDEHVEEEPTEGAKMDGEEY